MTKQELEQYIDLQAEIEDLRERLQELKQKEISVTECVKGSAEDFPYTGKSIKVHGHMQPPGRGMERYTIQLHLAKRLDEAEAVAEKITAYINTVKNSRIRRMMQYRYIDGKKWDEIGRLCHCERSTAIKAVEKYLKNHREE